ncbi:MAG TPA: hypothetical protein VKH15_10060 [Candidatus Acidoferrum sp.]|nr:hypothetical protein [Candidatus Acidoferrum sp.]
MTTFVAAKCPNCGGDLQVPTNRDSVKCMYCSGDVLLRRPGSAAPGGSVQNWMKLAHAALDAGNHEEVLSNTNKVLEVEPHNHDAWFLKGIASGWLSNLANCRLGEMTSIMRQAIAYAPPDIVAEVKEMSAVMINDAAVGYNDMACRHLREFVTVDGVWPEFIDQTGAAFEALDAAHEINPKNKMVIQNIIRILTDLINGVAYNDTDSLGRFTRRVHRLKADYSMKMTVLKQEYETKLQALDPSYKAPEVKKAKVGTGHIILTIMRLFGLTRF